MLAVNLAPCFDFKPLLQEFQPLLLESCNSRSNFLFWQIYSKILEYLQITIVPHWRVGIALSDLTFPSSGSYSELICENFEVSVLGNMVVPLSGLISLYHSNIGDFSSKVLPRLVKLSVLNILVSHRYFLGP